MLSNGFIRLDVEVTPLVKISGVCILTFVSYYCQTVDRVTIVCCLVPVAMILFKDIRLVGLSSLVAG